MAVEVVVRGSTAFIKANFFDKDDGVTNPNAATLTLEFPLPNGQRGHDSFALVQDGSDWTFEWDSRDAGHGTVYGHVETDDDPPVSSEDFKFELAANKANVAAHSS